MNISKYFDFINEVKMINFDKKEGNFVVIAGGPGSGKDFISNNFINLSGYKVFNVDAFRVFIAKKWWGDRWREKISTEDGYDRILKHSHTTSDPRNVTIKFLKQFLKIERSYLPNIVYNAGGGQVDVMRTIHGLAKAVGYETSIIYVEADEKIALIRNKERDRTLPDRMVIDYRDRVEAGKKEMIQLFDNVWSVDNSEYSTNRSIRDNIIKIK